MLIGQTLQIQQILADYQVKMDVKSENLFTVLERGDRKIKNAHRKAILLVGLTRAGKSTVFNWFLNKPMIGKGKLNSYFMTINEDNDVAKMSNRLVSMTLDPNMKVNFTQDTSLLDMAGFLDSRDHVGVIGVSYFLKAIFEEVRETKFVIVFDENRLKEESGKGITDTFNGFIDMFHYSELSSDLQEKFKKSLAVIVTRSREPENHYGYMSELIDKLKDEELQNVRNKEIVIELLQSVMNQNHVQEFKAAKENENPGECKILDHLSNVRGWDFFKLDEADSELGKSFIHLPIAQDFEKLQQKQKVKYAQSIKNRLHCYKQFSQIIKLLVETFISNWNEFLRIWDSQREVRPNYMQMQPFFQQIQSFLDINDLYKSEDSVNVEFRANYDPPTFISAVNQILMISEYSWQLGQVISNSFEPSELMAKLSETFNNLLSSFKMFCSSNEEEKLVARVQYIVERGFIEFKRLEDLRPETVSEFRLFLNDACQLDIRDQEFMNHFVSQIPSDLMPKLFNSFELLEEYESFLAKYENKFGDLPTQRCFVEIAKGDLLFKSGEKVKAFLAYSSATKTYLKQGQSILDSSRDDSQKESKLRVLFIKKIKMIQKIKDILVEEQARQTFNPQSYALQLCKYYNLVEDTCQVYEYVLASSRVSSFAKCSLYEEYAKFCLAWGRREKALTLLQKKMSLEDNDSGYFETAELICCLDSQGERLKDDMIRKLRERRWMEDDEELKNILIQIDGLIVANPTQSND